MKIELLINYRLVFIILAAITLNGCATGRIDMEEARNANFSEDPFREGLRQGYIELSDMENSSGDGEDAKRYANKAMILTKGIVPDMETLYNRDIPLTKMNELLGAKYFLEAAFANDMKEMQPAIAAEAQVMFDCWVEHAEESERFSSESNFCRNSFEQAKASMSKILAKIKQREYDRQQRALAMQRQKQEQEFRQKIADEKARLRAKYSHMPDPSFLFFDYNKTDLDITARNLLKKVAHDIKVFKPRKVVLTGNTDNTGSYKYNMKLALHRGAVAANYLSNLGVDPAILDVKAYGKNNPRRQSNRPQKDIRNRYVEIIFLKDNRVYY